MIDLKPFCDDDTAYYAIDKPWMHGGMIYATDTRLAVACAPELYDGELGPETTGKRRPKVHEVLAPALLIREWNDMPEVQDCAACNSTGRIKIFCTECCGRGLVTCNMDHEHDCDNCDESGEEIVECKQCPKKFEVGNRHILAWILRRILKLPGVKWATASDDYNHVVFVKFEGGYGAMMPLQQEVKREHKAGAMPPDAPIVRHWPAVGQ